MVLRGNGYVCIYIVLDLNNIVSAEVYTSAFPVASLFLSVSRESPPVHCSSTIFALPLMSV